MITICLAGGFGTRLRGVVDDRPKAMATINGVPFLTLLLKKLERHGCSLTVIAVGYMKKSIMGYYGDRFGNMPIRYSVETQPLGTGGAIKKAMALVDAERCMVINGDTYFDIDYDQFFNDPSLSKFDVSVALRRLEKNERYGSVQLFSDGRIIFNGEAKGGSGLVNAGAYIFRKGVFEDYDMPEAFSLEYDFLSASLPGLTIGGIEHNGYFIDIGTPATYKDAQVDLR